MSQNHIQEHVDLIARHEQDFLARRTTVERVGDAIAAFAGSLAFVILHMLIFLVWIGVNTLHFAHFDPVPYSLLATFVALEALILASFILIRQGRVSRRAGERDHLMLQILLLSEKEITTVLDMARQIAIHVGVEGVADRDDVRALSQHISIEDVAQTIQDSLPADE